MTKQDILDKFSDIDFVYNDCSKHDTLSMMLDELLKEQEPVKPILKCEWTDKLYNDYECPVCGNNICYEQKYCSECGRPVKWDD